MTVRIANGAGFWGDYPDAPGRLVEYGEFDYLTLEYLAEVTMGILTHLKDSGRSGYATDFIDFVIADHLERIVTNDITVVTNAGGIDPVDCAQEVLEIANDKELDLTVAAITGDDITDELSSITERGNLLRDIDTGEPFPDVDEASVAVAYMGAFPIANALDEGADIVITGRVADPALAMGPVIHEYGWDRDDHDKLAAGTVAGHLTECGPQVTGGNYLGPWRDLSFDDIGFPIAEVTPDGEVTITKPPESGGTVTTGTVSEQLIYEIGDPRAYHTPDVVADFTSPQVHQVAENRVSLDGIQGQPPTDQYKVTIHHLDGYKIAGQLLYSRPNALEKAQRAAEILNKRIDGLGLDIDQTHVDYIGHDAAHGAASKPMADHNEVMVRFAARSNSRQDLRRLSMEFAPLSLGGPPAVAGLTDQGRPSAQPIWNAWPTLVSKEWTEPEVRLYG